MAFYQERQIRPKRLTDAARFSLGLWSKFCNWKSALVIVNPETLIGWHRRGFNLFWKLKSRAGRPRLPKNIRQLIARMVEENPTWGQGRVADELALNLGIRVSPRTIGAYWPNLPDSRGPSSQRWNSFFRNHTRSMLACDFLVVVTAGLRQSYVFVLMDIGTRTIVRCNVTGHPTAAWTLQQFREVLPSEHGYRFVIHDRDSIFSASLDEEVKRSFGLRVLRTPVRAPKANAYCERLIGALRRECLDFMIPSGERHLRSLLKEWVAHYNQSSPHSSFDTGMPESSNLLPLPSCGRHTLPEGSRVMARPVLGGLHHEHRLERFLSANPVPPPAIPVLAERGGTQLKTPRPVLVVDTREQNPFDFSRFEG
ncbi:MAG: integrase core domain-containing protein [Acidobacteriota bacterium]|nr:integrase core domain-containing protein [Acidobacteriota bacterium]